MRIDKARRQGAASGVDAQPDPDLATDLDLVRAPEWIYSLTASYDVDLSDAGLPNLRASYSYTDEIPVNDVNSFYHEDYGLVDACIAWNSPSEALQAALWGKNPTDERRAETGSFTGIGACEFLTEPRTYGVEITYHFDQAGPSVQVTWGWWLPPPFFGHCQCLRLGVLVKRPIAANPDFDRYP